MTDLVERLSRRDSPVVLGGPWTPPAELRRRIEQLRYVRLEFTGTRGGTVLGVTVDPAATDLTGADFAAGRGTVHVEGTLVLNHVPVRCVADLDLETRSGTGRLAVAAHPDR